MTTQQIYTKIIMDFLKEHPYISFTPLERAAKIPTGSIAQAKIRGTIAENSIFPLLFELSKLGIKDRHGYTLSPEPSTFCIVGRKFVETIETSKGIFDGYKKKIYTNYTDL